MGGRRSEKAAVEQEKSLGNTKKTMRLSYVQMFYGGGGVDGALAVQTTKIKIRRMSRYSRRDFLNGESRMTQNENEV